MSYVLACVLCETRKSSTVEPQGSMEIIYVEMPYEKISIDVLVAFLKTTGDNAKIIVAVDYPTRGGGD